MKAEPAFQSQIGDILKAEKDAMRDQETLVKGFIKSCAIKTVGEQTATATLHVLTGVSIVLSAVDLYKAGVTSKAQHSINRLLNSLRERPG